MLEKQVLKPFDPGGKPTTTKKKKKRFKKISKPKGRKEIKKKIVKLKKREDWTDDELDILENISSNTQGIPDFLVNSLRSGLCKIDNGIKLHKRMYKDGSVKEKGK